MKKPKAPKLVTVAVSTTITIIFWIFFTLYQVLTNKPSPSVNPVLLEPINPTLDTENLEKIQGKVFLDEGSFIFTPPQGSNQKQESTPVPTKKPSLTPEPSPTPEAASL